MKRIFSILLLLNFLLFITPINTGKSIAKQFSTSIPAEEENGSSKTLDAKEFEIKLVHPVTAFNFTNDAFYLISKEKFAHFHLHIPAVDWLETFSPPPDKA